MLGRSSSIKTRKGCLQTTCRESLTDTMWTPDGAGLEFKVVSLIVLEPCSELLGISISIVFPQGKSGLE